ncbi:hypothetical protein RS130_00745 [Paraglaciecola aquimarina]|uniref:Uncharacterized protein n=1 Tax=Paraglaciecola aquimarina TaxID=1235557 RepID=A0ABU3SRK0_9ALTE|nr:hypothetical protein [Paraglaciecola aquimarina]MDU0352639.1 hypothetical protein [Paraglaciecola aquimarina]
MSAYDEELIQGAWLSLGNLGRFKALGTHIPKDTSAAAFMLQRYID